MEYSSHSHSSNCGDFDTSNVFYSECRNNLKKMPTQGFFFNDFFFLKSSETYPKFFSLKSDEKKMLGHEIFFTF